MKIKTKMYLNSDDGHNNELFVELSKQHKFSISDESRENFSVALYEVEFIVELDTDTGNVKILECDGKELKE